MGVAFSKAACAALPFGYPVTPRPSNKREPRLRSPRGQATIEYLGITVVSALVVLAIAFAAPAIGGDIANAMERAVCQLLNGDCEDTGGSDAGPDGIPGTDDDPGGGPGRDGIPGTEDDPGDPGPDGVRGTEDDPDGSGGSNEDGGAPCVGAFDTPRCVQQLASESEKQIRALQQKARDDLAKARTRLAGLTPGTPEYQRELDRVNELRNRVRSLDQVATSRFGRVARKLNTTPDDLLKNLPDGVKKVSRHLPLLGIPVSAANNINKDGLAKGITETVFEELASTAAAAGGGAVCGAATVASLGLAGAPCAVGVAGLTVGAGEAGNAVGGFIYDNREYAVLAGCPSCLGQKLASDYGPEITAGAKKFNDVVLAPAGNTITAGAKTVNDEVLAPVGNVANDILPGNFP